PYLVKFWPALSLSDGATVLVPLCGKSRDVLWLADQGFQVIGVEASAAGLEQLREASGQSFTQTSRYGNAIYCSDNVALWEANFLSLPAKALPPVDAIYDKASIVALPPAKREIYARKIIALCGSGTQILLQTFDYDQTDMHGPPFSVPEKEITRLFGGHLNIELLHERSMLNDVDKFRRRGLRSRFIERLYHLHE
ncbi:MAG TPA: hypothetical protein VK112_13220, partial [Fodinibius sp.]|nr:hypothetical protein [Fodinibius sp.]